MIMRKRNFMVIIFFWILFYNGQAQNVYTLRNQKIEVSIDRNGNMTTLKNLQTGFNYASGKPIWRIYFDRKNEKDIEVLSKDNLPSVQQAGNQILISYNGLKSRTEIQSFELYLKIVLEEDKVRFSSKLINNELHTVIRELQYPLVAGCRIPSGHQLLTTQRGGHIYSELKEKISSLPHTFMGPDNLFRQMGMKYPAGVASNCFAMIGADQGLYFGSHDSTFQDTWHGFRLYPDENGDFNELEAGFYKFPNCLYGQSWSNDANVIAPYSGDWHETSKLYRAWADTWWKHREEPLWVKQMSGFQRIILRHQYGETFFTYKDFATRVKKAGESVGINTVFPFGWWNSGMDNGYPDSYYLTDPDQGGDEAWKKAIADYKNGGGKVLLYFNGKLIDTESDYYKNGDGKEVCIKSNTGTELTEEYRFSGPGKFTGYYNSRSFVVADTKNPKWQEELQKMADRAIELGANSVFYDQLGYGEKVGNWDLSKEFPVPDLQVIADKANSLKMIHDYIDTKDKDLAIGTEHITDVTSQYVDYVHGIYHIGDWTVKDNTNFIEWFRYTFPEIIITDRNVDGIEPNIEWLTNRAVLLGLRTNVQTFRLRATIDETPRYQKYLARVNRVKEKYCSLLLEGTYHDTEGFLVDNKEMEARSFINGNQMAVVMTHESPESKLTQISVPGYRYVESTGIGAVTVGNKTNKKQSITIGKDGLVVLIYAKR
jgi:Domain of unknown function (DUF6259)